MRRTPVDWLARSRLTARQLALIVQLDERRSVLHAAEAAHMTQPAASRLLHSVEDALGVPLFERHARGVVPTAYGEVLVRHARAALAEFRQAHEEVAALVSGVAGEVRIGTTITSATDLVPMAVAELNGRHPAVRVTIELGFSEALVDELLAHKVDIAIARLHPAHELRGLDFAPLGEEPHGIVVRSGHPLACRRTLDLADLGGNTWVLPPPGNVMRDRLTLLFLQQGVEQPRHVVETSALPVITSLLRASDMVAPLPIEVLRPYFDSGMFVRLPVRLDLQLGAAGIVTLHNHQLSPASRAMMDELHSVAKRLYPRQDAGARPTTGRPRPARRRTPSAAR
jgi:DNA-binding transcriptional LysR family regulator